MEDFIYWRHPTLPGIKVEEICGGEGRTASVWREMACQVWCENGKDGYRELGHYRNGEPFVNGSDGRISISHCDGLYVVATLPDTPEVDLSVFSLRAAMGVDAERSDREQVLNVRSRFLSEAEMAMVDADDVKANVIAWTVKEAVYKAALTEGLALREGIKIEKMPGLSPAVPVYDKEEFPQIVYGRATALVKPDSSSSPEFVEFDLYSYESEGCIVTLAYSPRCAKFTKIHK